MKILCLGPLVVDQLYNQATGDRWEYPGGNATIFAATAARFGCEVTVYGRLGLDDSGAMVASQLEQNSVDTSCVARISELETKHCAIEVAEDGTWERSDEQRGLYPYLDLPERWPPTPCDHVHFAGLTSLLRSCPDETLELVRRTRETGLSISFGLNSTPLAKPNVLSNALRKDDLISCNLAEFAQLNNCTINTPDECVHLLAGGEYSRCAVTFGADGATARDGKDVCLRARVNQVRSVNTLGAGDVFSAAFLSLTKTRQAVDVSLRIAVSTATSSVMGRNWDEWSSDVTSFAHAREVEVSSVPLSVP